jgi:hypothetical protein
MTMMLDTNFVPPQMNFLAILVAALAAFAASSVWYMAFGNKLAKVSPAFAAQKPAAWKMLVVVAQNLVLAYVLAYFMTLIEGVTWIHAIQTGVILWVGLSAMQWVGSMVWEKVPLKMAAIHAGDWLVKLVLICAILGAWRR